MILISKKWLKKNEFRYCTHKSVVSPNGKGHNAYISAKSGHNCKVNIITHSDRFFGEPTVDLLENPNKSKFDKRKSKISVPVMLPESSLKVKSNGVWRLSKKDRIAIKKFNKKYDKKTK